MLNKPGAVQRKLIVLGSCFGSIAQLAGGLWQSDSGKRWLVPLAIFLAVSGIVLAIAASVEALAPFVYSIF
jgi:Family of unknown function (DUF5989)